MAIQVQPFTPQRVVQQAQQNRVNPWAQLLPNLTQAVVMGMVQNKLQGNLEKQRVKQEMLAKGYVWDEEKQTWLPPAAQIEPVAPGVSVVSKGGSVFQVKDPRFETDEDIRKAKATQEFGLESDLTRMGKQNEYQLGQAAQQAKLSLENAMTQRGAKRNEKGDWEYEPPTFGKDEASGIHYMQVGDNAVQVEPIGEATVTPIPGMKNKSIVQFGKRAEIVDTGSGWLDDNGNPRTFDLPGGITGSFTSANSVQLFNTEGKGQMSDDEATKALEAHLKDVNALPEDHNRIKTKFVSALAKKVTPINALFTALEELNKGNPAVAEGTQLKVGAKIGGRTIAKTGKEKGTGRTVIQFTDGTTTYAD
jgi:hypothetical protein